MAENNMLGMAPIFAPPERTVTTTLPTNSSTRKVRDKFTIGAEKQMDQAGQAQIEVADNQIERENKIAETEAELARKEAERIQAAQVLREQQEQDRVKQLEALKIEERRQQDAVDKAAKPTGYWEEMSTPRRIIAALAIGLGSSVGGNAYEIYKDAAERDRQKKLGILEAEKDKLARMGASREQIEAEIARKVRLIGQQEETNLKLLAKNAEAVKRSLPHAAGKAEAFRAEILKDLADRKVKNANEFASSSTYHSGSQSVTTAENKGAGGKDGVTAEEGKNAGYAVQMKADIETIKKSEPFTAGERKKLMDNIRSQANIAENATKGLFGAEKVKAMQSLGITPESLYTGIPQSKVPAAIAWLRAAGLINRTESGAAITAPEELKNWQLYGPQVDDNIDTVRYRVKELERKQLITERLAGPNAAKRLADPQPTADSAKKKFSAEDAEIAKWASENIGTEKADKIIKMLRVKYGN